MNGTTKGRTMLRRAVVSFRIMRVECLLFFALLAGNGHSKGSKWTLRVLRSLARSLVKRLW